MLLVLSQALDQFFWEVDRVLSPEEFSLLKRLPTRLEPEPEDMGRLEKATPPDDWSARQLALLQTLLGVRQK